MLKLEGGLQSKFLRLNRGKNHQPLLTGQTFCSWRNLTLNLILDCWKKKDCYSHSVIQKEKDNSYWVATLLEAVFKCLSKTFDIIGKQLKINPFLPTCFRTKYSQLNYFSLNKSNRMYVCVFTDYLYRKILLIAGPIWFSLTM